MTPSHRWCAHGGLLVIAVAIAVSNSGPIAFAGSLDILMQHRTKQLKLTREWFERFDKIRSECRRTGEAVGPPRGVAPSRCTDVVSFNFRFYGPTM